MAGRDVSCWGRFDKEAEDLVPVIYQVRNTIFSRVDDCVVWESLYWTLQDIGTFQVYQFMCAAALVFTTFIGVFGLLFPGGFILLVQG